MSSMPHICSLNGSDIDLYQEAKSFAMTSGSDHLTEDPQQAGKTASEHPVAT
jgi:hypothetical protein